MFDWKFLVEVLIGGGILSAIGVELSRRRYESQKESLIKKAEAVKKAISELCNYNYERKCIHHACESLCELLNHDFTQDLKKEIQEKTEEFANSGNITTDQIKNIFKILEKEFQNPKLESIETLSKIIKSENFIPRDPVGEFVDLLMGREKNWNAVTCRKIEIILAQCLEKPDQEIRIDEIKELWRKERDVDTNDLFADDKDTVAKILKNLDGRKKGERHLKKVLEYDESKKVFYVKKENIEFLRSTLKTLEEEQERLNLRKRGQGVV